MVVSRRMGHGVGYLVFCLASVNTFIPPAFLLSFAICSFSLHFIGQKLAHGFTHSSAFCLHTPKAFIDTVGLAQLAFHFLHAYLHTLFPPPRRPWTHHTYRSLYTYLALYIHTYPLLLSCIYLQPLSFVLDYIRYTPRCLSTSGSLFSW